MPVYGGISFMVRRVSQGELPLWSPGPARWASFPVPGTNREIVQYGGRASQSLSVVAFVIDNTDVVQEFEALVGITKRTLEDYPEHNGPVDYPDVYLRQVQNPITFVGSSHTLVQFQLEFGRPNP